MAVIQVNSGGNAFDSAGMAVLPDAVFILEISFCDTSMCYPYSISFHEVDSKYGFQKCLVAVDTDPVSGGFHVSAEGSGNILQTSVR